MGPDPAARANTRGDSGLRPEAMMLITRPLSARALRAAAARRNSSGADAADHASRQGVLAEVLNASESWRAISPSHDPGAGHFVEQTPPSWLAHDAAWLNAERDHAALYESAPVGASR